MGSEEMTGGWYALRRGGAPGAPEGPFTWAELLGRAAAGLLTAGDLVWHPRLSGWTPAGQIAALIPIAPAGPAAAATPASPPPLPAWAQSTGRPPAPAVPPPLPADRRRPSWLAPVLVPTVALVVVAVALGVYFGAFYGTDGETVSTGPRTTATVPAVTTSESASPTDAVPSLGTVQIAVPQAGSLVDTAEWGQVPADEVTVVLVDGKGRADAEQIAQALGGSVVGEIELIGLYQIRTAGKTESDLTASLEQAAGLPGVELAFPNQQISFAEEIWGVRKSPLNDPAYTGDFGKGYTLIGAQKAWNYIKGAGLGLSPVKTGVIDTYIYNPGAEFGGPSGLEQINPPGPQTGRQQIVSGGKTVANPNGSHANMVAGIIGADPTNGGQTGLASPVLGNKLSLVSIDLYGADYGDVEVDPDPDNAGQYIASDGKAYALGGIAAMAKAVLSGCRVINCSWGATKPGGQNAAIAAAYRKFFAKAAEMCPGVTFVCAAGNETGAIDPTNYYPAGAGSGLPNVITVGNVMNDTSAADSSNTANADKGGEVTLAAPGYQAVQGADENGDPITDQTDIEGKGVSMEGGTSAAAPQVSAAAAMLISLDPTLTAARVKKILSETTRPGPAGMGSGILAMDEAVFKVINMVRTAKGLPELTREQLEAMGVIDAVATTTDQPNVYNVKGILVVVNEDGTQVSIKGSDGVSVGGDATQAVKGPAATAEWPSVTVDPSALEPTITVARSDTGASSVISLAKFDINGSWTGTVTFTGITGDPAAAGGGGCSLADLQAVLNKPFPMGMEVTVDEKGGGTAVVTVDLSSLNKKGETWSMDPLSFSVQLFARDLVFEDAQVESATVSMIGSVARQGDGLVMTGQMILSGDGAEAKAEWKVTLP